MKVFISWSPNNRTYDVKDSEGNCLFYGSANSVVEWLIENDGDPTLITEVDYDN